MINPNGRITKRKMVRLMIALTILAWATQTLLHQWGFGAEIGLADQQQQPPEKFVPADAMSRGATLELRPEATISTPEIKLRQVCRWSDADRAAVAPLAELVIGRVSDTAPFKSISLDEIKTVLHDAGVNLASINFVGTTTCTVNRGDVQYDERIALRQWIAAKQGLQSDAAAVADDAAASTTQPTNDVPATDANLATTAQVKRGGASAPGAGDNKNPFRTLRDVLIGDVAERLNVPAETLQLNFKAQDEKLLNLAEPHFHFDVEPQRLRTLGNVRWTVTLTGGDGSSQKLQLSAIARAWQTQLLLTKPLAYKQLIQQSDVVERRALVDQISDEPLVTADQAIGQQAARELKPGTVLTGRMLDPVQLVKPGQFVTISVANGAVQVRTVARALEPGSFGQTIKVKNETTREVFDVTITGPQTATLNTPPIPAG